MSVTDRDRHDLYVAARDTLGQHPAEVLMAMLPATGWADVATRADLRAVEARLDARIDRVEAKLEAIDAKFEAKFEKLEARIGAIVPQQTMANLAIMAALLALVFTILRFA